MHIAQGNWFPDEDMQREIVAVGRVLESLQKQ